MQANLTTENESNKENHIKEINNQQSNFRQPLSPSNNQIEERMCMETETEEANNDQDMSDAQNIEFAEKSLKAINTTQMCQEILKIVSMVSSNKLLAMPYMRLNIYKQIPYYPSLQALIDHAELNGGRMQALVECRLQVHSFSPLTCVYVHCKECDYINFVPLSWASIHQTIKIKQLLHRLDQKDFTDHLRKEIETNDLNEQKRQNAANFSLRWLHEASPKKWEWLQNASYYECPRCLYNQELKQDKNAENVKKIPLLEYMYRFWFKIKDASSEIDYCLMESDLAEK